MTFTISYIVNRRDAYLVEALIQLAESYPGSLKVAEIARRRDIPEAFLARLLAGAARQGVVATSRGPRGGVRLLRPPETMSLAEVLGERARRPAGSPAAAWLDEQLARARTRTLAGIHLSELLTRDHEAEGLIWNI